MYLVAGANLLGQWFSSNSLFTNFQPLSECSTDNLKFDLLQAKLIDTTWSYNIFQIDHRFYISGSWRGKDNSFLRVKLPEECERIVDPNILMMVGNDYSLILVNVKTHTAWVINLETDEVKKLNIGAESPLATSIEHRSKKVRRDNKIIKVVTKNNSCLYLTSEGVVYTGMLPTYLDTRQCEGKVCDVQVGYEHFMLLTDLGRIYTWGNGRRLQLGHGDITNFDLPKLLEALAGIKIVKIKAGGWHSLALSESGDLYAWGWNDTGQLGIRSDQAKLKGLGVLKKDGLNSYRLPTLVDFYDEDGNEVELNVIDIACGTRHSAVLLEDNTVWTSGCNKYGQLGFSPEVQPVVNYFKRSFHCGQASQVFCAPWATVLSTNL